MSRRQYRSTRYGQRSRTPGRQRPAKLHAPATIIAICRRADGAGRRYFTCRTREQALQHGPYLIEHVNGWGQVTRRERFTPGVRDAT
jgi:transposase